MSILSKKILYLGTSPSNFSSEEEVLHYPVIRLVPKSIQEERVRFCLSRLSLFSHCLLTSKNSVEILWDLCLQLSLNPTAYLQDKCISIGPMTSDALRRKKVEPILQSLESTQEGLIDSLQGIFMKEAYVLYPRSSLARSILSRYLAERGIAHEVLDLYDTVYQALDPKPSLDQIKEIVFTSPSTVEGFFKVFDKIPKGMRISFQGLVTQQFFADKFKSILINF